jgi:O-acetyl-ADP-ribose deacetylase (regulator of RNase III)
MSVHIVKGDLLKSDCTIIAHQCNCYSKMGAGIAKQIANLYPEAYTADRTSKLSPHEKLGKFSVASIPGKSLVIFNLYGQLNYGRGQRQTDYNSLEISLSYMFEMIRTKQDTIFKFPIKIGLPYLMGCGLAGGDWNIVSDIIQKVSDRFQLDVYVYQL